MPQCTRMYHAIARASFRSERCVILIRGNSSVDNRMYIFFVQYCLLHVLCVPLEIAIVPIFPIARYGEAVMLVRVNNELCGNAQ